VVDQLAHQAGTHLPAQQPGFVIGGKDVVFVVLEYAVVTDRGGGITSVPSAASTVNFSSSVSSRSEIRAWPLMVAVRRLER